MLIVRIIDDEEDAGADVREVEEVHTTFDEAVDSQAPTFHSDDPFNASIIVNEC